LQKSRVTFENADGLELAAWLELPESGQPVAFALFAHCFTCSKDVLAAANVSRALAADGIGVLRFDFTGLGDSEGEFEATTFATNVDDLVAAAEYLAAEWRAPELLVGHSLGGTAALLAATRIPSVTAVATIGSPASPGHVRQLLTADEEDAIRDDGEATVELAGRPFRIRRAFLHALDAADMEAVVGGLGRALLVLHSPVDEIVSVDEAAKIFWAAKHPRSFVSLDSADHLLTDPSDSRYAGRVLAAWSSRYLSPDTPRVESAAADEPVVVRLGRTGLRADIVAEGHALVSDEPTGAGGTDLGPSPYGYLLAALGACEAMTLRLYADRKGWPLEGVTVALRHGRVHVEDCAAPDKKDCWVDRVDVRLALEGPLDEEQRRRLVEISGRCPVNRTLRRQVVVDTSLAGEP
jgi:putative redox protein